jgi:uncharacterized protein (TIGR02246 family)
MTDTAADPLRLVLDMVDAYNARDLEGTMSYYSEDAVIVDAQGDVIDSGASAIREIFDEVFTANPELRADVPTTIRVGDWVMIHSIVEDWVHRDGSHSRMEWVELYHVAAGKIDRLQLFA